ncbi:MAG: prolyl oligopeptidase family serine peptidase [Gammaproteobacteria bacterium]|nr:prolyl oligopeptidase family serine peptidase [Gammaproteobacteria bacterium]
MSENHRIRPYGSWESRVSTELITAGSIRLSSPAADQGKLYWIEGRPQEQGRSVLICRDQTGQELELSPASFNIRSRVHEYGGAPWLAAAGRCWFIDFADQRIYETGPAGPTSLTDKSSRRYADMEFDQLRGRLLAVCEDHPENAQEACNTLAAIDLQTGQQTPLVQGADFYSNPRLSPNGKQLAWLSWNHPQMPWDGSELWLAELSPEGEPGNPRRLAGSSEESIFQPQWGPDGRLFFVSDADGWWNLFCWDGHSCRQITHEKAEMGLPQWVFGMSTYGLLDQDTAIASFRGPGLAQVLRIDLASGQTRTLELPCSSIEHLAIQDGTLLVLGGSPDQALTLYAGNAETSELEAIKCSVSLELESEWVSRGTYLEFPSGDGDLSRGYYYPPWNPNTQGPDQQAPPLIVMCHGGPTAGASPVLDLRIQFWTSRGFAVLDVDYRGSTGYGRHYRRALYGKWGVADVEDCVSGSRFLCQQGLADPKRLLIRGSSAGGYLVLCAAAFHEQFSAGASYYGIGDLESLFADTHKFESRYDRSLLGDGDLNRLCAQRSPARHAESIHMPLIMFQGLDDKVVPPAQSENMFRILKAKGVPVAYLTFEGEGHGFRKARTIADSLQSELAFYCRILGISPAGSLPEVAINNFPGS